MKNKIKSLFIKLLLPTAIIFIAAAYPGFGQNPVDDKTKALIDTKNFIFRAETAIPQRGGTRYLTSEYDLRVSKDTVIAFLPYFGRAYTAPMDPTKGGIKFTSTDFEYTARQKKRGWDITITPKDATDADVRYLVLSISNKGYGSLRVICNNRDAISFSGYITGVKKK